MRGKLSQALFPAGRPARACAPTHHPLRSGFEPVGGRRPARCSFLPLLGILLISALAGCPLSPRESSERRGVENGGAHPSERTAPEPDGHRAPPARAPYRMTLDVHTTDSEGTIEIELLPELAPESVARVVSLAREGHYDGTTFHRVIRGFMIQGGDPNSRDQDPSNDGKGGALPDLPDELSETPFERGIVALAHRGRSRSNSSQFFILQSDHRDLDGRYTAIGRVTRGLEVVDSIANVPTDKVGRWGPKDRPIENVSIRRARIVEPEQTASASLPHRPSPAPVAP